MINDQSKMIANYMIECHGILHAPVDCSQIVVSTHWIRFCLEVDIFITLYYKCNV